MRGFTLAFYLAGWLWLAILATDMIIRWRFGMPSTGLETVIFLGLSLAALFACNIIFAYKIWINRHD